MRIDRCSDQKHATLEEFYTANDHPPGAGKAMLDLIDRLRSQPDDRRLWALTSHARLVFLTEDSFRSPWKVIVGALDGRNYFIEYVMPASDAPWPDAYVRGNARSEAEAVQMILTALNRAG